MSSSSSNTPAEAVITYRENVQKTIKKIDQDLSLLTSEIQQVKQHINCALENLQASKNDQSKERLAYAESRIAIEYGKSVRKHLVTFDAEFLKFLKDFKNDIDLILKDSQ